MASPQAIAAKEQARAFRNAALGAPGAEPPSLELMRAGADMMMGNQGVMPDGVAVSDATIAGLAALDIRPDGASADHVLLYLHGGGYVLGSPQSHVKMTAAIAKAAGCRAVSVDYRMAPEHPHPAPVNDALAAYRALLDQGIAAERTAIAGDSAGGGLTVAALLAIRDAGLPQPGAAVPISPWIDLEGTGESMVINADNDMIVSQDALKGMVDMFVAGGDVRDPLAAPLYADLTGLTPMYIQVGGDETLLDDSTRLAAIAARVGVEIRLDVFPEMQHVFQMGVGEVPEADDAVARIGQYLRWKWSLD